jgi:hypothetical protein
MARLLSRLPPLELRILHLALGRAAALEAEGQSAAAETILLELREIVRRPVRRPSVAVSAC